jgi:hypothetical protein
MRKIQTEEVESVKYKREKLFVHRKERVWSFIRVMLYYFLKSPVKNVHIMTRKKKSDRRHLQQRHFK